ncbi:MAG: N-acetyltransferase [Lachnospiraceae bacterium]|nr:N-acetyltransferase [Lachnospiraceae bacterium]
MEGENYLVRKLEVRDTSDLLSVYSDEKSVPLFNSDNCNGDDFHYTSLERMQHAVEFWLWSYTNKYFVRFSIIDKRIQKVIRTIELFHRDSKDYFNRCGLLRLDLKSDYDLFDCDMVATKIPTFAGERKAAAVQNGFFATDKALVGGDDGKVYTNYYVRLHI